MQLTSICEVNDIFDPREAVGPRSSTPSSAQISVRAPEPHGGASVTYASCPASIRFARWNGNELKSSPWAALVGSRR
jgi:hypothetical protein